MIVMSIKEINGDCKIEGYKKWITLESFGFGTERKIEAAKHGGGRDLETGSGSDTQEFTVSKTADIATVDLMYASIKHRATGEAAAPFTIDIAFLEPRAFRGDDDNVDKGFVKAYLKIRFGKALIKSWSISGDAGKRATESLAFWYNQVTMAYDTPSDDLSGYKTYGPKGWDQLEGKDWVPSGWK
jgi:type VI protein secretion system component Hcp